MGSIPSASAIYGSSSRLDLRVAPDVIHFHLDVAQSGQSRGFGSRWSGVRIPPSRPFTEGQADSWRRHSPAKGASGNALWDRPPSLPPFHAVLVSTASTSAFQAESEGSNPSYRTIQAAKVYLVVTTRCQRVGQGSTPCGCSTSPGSSAEEYIPAKDVVAGSNPAQETRVPVD